MIPNHERFLEAIREKRKVRVRLYSVADNGVVDRVCAPLDYGLDVARQDGLNRYWLWDYAQKAGSESVALLPQEILDLQMLGEDFDPASLQPGPDHWSIPRNWGSHSTNTPGASPPQETPSKS
jgi:hypothetical protein